MEGGMSGFAAGRSSRPDGRGVPAIRQLAPPLVLALALAGGAFGRFRPSAGCRWGFGILPKLVVIALVCFFPVLVTTVDALASVDAEEMKLLRTLGASRRQALRFVELPAALPAALSGAR